ncbi:MAG: 1-acyl-sn-glycerol-3-phosphate acyltransferase [Firmicutes bacterium]|nr:1-acyl-sn-glycerol-3-phosphate acyltransferase [Bacillota bacterium]
MDVWFYRLVRPIVKLFFYFVYRPKVIGKENVPKKGRIVIASNHTDYFDCVALVATNKRTIHFLAKDELLKGFWGPAFKAMGIIPVNRREKDKNALPAAIKVLEEERVIGIFPEGTFKKDVEELLPFKIGAVKMAHDAESMILPMAIVGEFKPFRKGLTLRFGKPYKITSDDLDKENDKLKKKIQDLIDKERGN